MNIAFLAHDKKKELMVSTRLEPRKTARHPDDSIPLSLINNSFGTGMFEEKETQPDIALHKQKRMIRS